MNETDIFPSLSFLILRPERRAGEYTYCHLNFNLQVLLLNGADVNSVDSGMRSALLSACWQGHLVIADILLTAGASVNHQCGQVRL